MRIWPSSDTDLISVLKRGVSVGGAAGFSTAGFSGVGGAGGLSCAARARTRNIKLCIDYLLSLFPLVFPVASYGPLVGTTDREKGRTGGSDPSLFPGRDSRRGAAGAASDRGSAWLSRNPINFSRRG